MTIQIERTSDRVNAGAYMLKAPELLDESKFEKLTVITAGLFRFKGHDEGRGAVFTSKMAFDNLGVTLTEVSLTFINRYLVFMK